VLPTPYFHTVFTVPHTLHPLILGNKRPLLTLLFRTANQTRLQFGRQNLDGQLGATMVLHTWDQTLNAHFHLHCLVPAGALAEDGTRWVPTHPCFLFPVQALSTVFRAKFLAALPQAYNKEALSFAQEPAWHGSLTSFTHLLDQLYGQAWVVYAKPSCAGPVQVLAYLGRYIHRVAMANHRLRDIRNGHVRFTYRNRRQGNQVQTMTLEAHEFSRRLLLHLVPHGFQRLRHVGFRATRGKARALRPCRQLRGQPTELLPREQPSAVEWMRQRTGIDITQCPHCGHGPRVRSPLHPLIVLGPSREDPLEVRSWTRHDLELGMPGPHRETPRTGLPGPKGSRACPRRLAPRRGRLHARSGATLVHGLEGMAPDCMPLGARPPSMVDAAQAPYRDTIPIRTCWSVVPRLSATAFYPSWGTTRDKTLFVRLFISCAV
jgi:putative transposase